jgi:hypothetical protein
VIYLGLVALMVYLVISLIVLRRNQREMLHRLDRIERELQTGAPQISRLRDHNPN